MAKNTGLMLTCILLVAGIAAGCKQKQSATPSSEPAHASGYFQTPFQSEAQFIVEAVVSDMAEQMVYAANHRLPDKKHFSVTATEKPGSSVDEPTYELQIRLDHQKR